MKKLIVLSVIVLITLSSCSRYINTGGGNGGCGAWMPKKYSGKAPKMRGNAQMVSF
jgi:hypothetical protein